MVAPVVAAGLIAGGAAITGSAINYISQNSTNSQMRDMARKAHQREVDDLRKAGLNPMLSANKGSVTPNLEAPRVDTTALASSAYNVAMMKSTMGLQSAQTEAAAGAAQASSAQAEGTRLNNDFTRSANIARLEVLKNEVVTSDLNNNVKRKQVEEIDANINKIRAETLRLGWSAKNEQKDFEYGRWGSQIMKPVETMLNSGKRWNERMEDIRLKMPTDNKGWYWTPEGLRKR